MKQSRIRSVLTAGMMALLTTPAAVLAQGTLLVSDMDGDKVVRFRRPTGTPFHHLVDAGVSALDDARGMTIGPDGNLYVASYDSSSVLRYDGRTGEPLGELVPPGEGGLFRPGRITFGPDGNLYVTSWNNVHVQRFDGQTGSFMDAFVGDGPVSPSGSASGLAFSPVNGDFYVASYSDAKVLRYDGQTGDFIEEAFSSTDGLWVPDELLFDEAGTLYVASFRNDSVWTLPDGGVPTLLIPSGTGGLSRPTSLAIDPASESLLVVSSNVSSDGQVLEFNKETGAFIGVFVDSLVGGLSPDLPDIVFQPDPIDGDLDHDGDVDIVDFAAFQTAFTGPGG